MEQQQTQKEKAKWLMIESVATSPGLVATQKVRGLAHLVAHGGYPVPRPVFIFRSAGELEELASRKMFGKPAMEWLLEWYKTEFGEYPFARACPPRARHGFVDSRQVAKVDDLRDLFKEIAEAGGGEVMLSPYVDSKWNAVITPSHISLGAGNAGATSGRAVLTIPATLEDTYLRKALEPGMYPYIEGVVPKPVIPDERPIFFFTQLREGPKPPEAASDLWLPGRRTKMVVKEVINCPEEDAPGRLLEWERRLKEASPRPGVVVYLGDHGWTSHWAVQALAHKIAVSKKPVKVGEVLIRDREAVPDQVDYPRVAAMLAATLGNWDEKRLLSPNYLLLAMIAGHSAGIWRTTDLAKVVGFGVAHLIQTSILFGVGEARHAPPHLRTASPSSNGDDDGESGDEVAAFPAQPVAGLDWLWQAAKNGNSSRSGVWKEALKLGKNTINLLPSLIELFERPGWSSSYGGKNWASSMKHAKNLLDLARAFIAQPDEGGYAALIGGVNLLVGAVHNNGPLHNKLVPTEMLNQLAHSTAPAIACVADELIQLIES